MAALTDDSDMFFHDQGLALRVLRFLDPVENFERVSIVCTRFQVQCSADELWEALLMNWPYPGVSEISYVGKSFTGQKLVAHVYSVLKANARFYRHVADGHASQDEILSTILPTSTVVHPGGSCLAGDRALESWHRLLGRQTQVMPVTCVRQRWRIHDGMAVVICGEDLGTDVVEATNVFENGKEGWRMSHHHGSLFHEMLPRW
jgi:hypothetical protein